MRAIVVHAVDLLIEDGKLVLAFSCVGSSIDEAVMHVWGMATVELIENPLIFMIYVQIPLCPWISREVSDFIITVHAFVCDMVGLNNQEHRLRCLGTNIIFDCLPSSELATGH